MFAMESVFLYRMLFVSNPNVIMKYLTYEAYARKGVDTINKLGHSEQLFNLFARTHFIKYKLWYRFKIRIL